MRKMLYAIPALLLFASCGSNQSAHHKKDNPDNAVKITGAMRNVMHKGELFGTIAIDTLSNKQHLYGLGPLEYLKGEIMIIDGSAYVSNVVDDTVMKVEENWNAKAPFFVYVHVENWKQAPLPDSIQSIAQLENFLNAYTKNQVRPFAFKVIATIEAGNIHIVNLPDGTVVHSPEEAHQNQQSYELKNEEVEMIGFFSTEHQGVFTHHDSYVHIHLITKDRKKMGHLDQVSLKKGTVKLFLPAQ